MVWKPHVTVAAVVEREGKFLLVEEYTPQGIGFNQPAGHLEANESLVEAVVREVLEETAYHFMPTALLGLYQWTTPDPPATSYLRIAFIGEVSEPRTMRSLDEGIIRADWFDLQAIKAFEDLHRGPMVWQCINDYLAGKRFALTLLNDLNGVYGA